MDTSKLNNDVDSPVLIPIVIEFIVIFIICNDYKYLPIVNIGPVDPMYIISSSMLIINGSLSPIQLHSFISFILTYNTTTILITL